MEALQRGKRRRGDWSQAPAGATKRPAGGGVAAPANVFPKAAALHDKLGSSSIALLGRPSARTPVAPSAPGRPSPATSPLDEPSAVQPADIVDDEDDPEDFELSLSEESENEGAHQPQRGGSNAPLSGASPPLPTVAEASAFVAAIAASPQARQNSDADVAAGATATTGSRPDVAARLAALLEKRPKLKVVKTTKNKLSSRELAGLSDDEDEHKEAGDEPATAVADEIRRRREARLQAARKAMEGELASSARGGGPSNLPLTIDLT